MNWDAVAAIAQVAEALVIVASAYLIYHQLEQIRTERMHKRWEAFQWAADLISAERIAAARRGVDHLVVFERSRGTMPDENIRTFFRFMRDLDLVCLALRGGYVDQDLLLVGRGWELGELYRELIADDHGPSMKSLVVSLQDSPGWDLLRTAFDIRVKPIRGLKHDRQADRAASFWESVARESTGNSPRSGTDHNSA